MRKLLLILSLITIAFAADAQLMDQKKTFTRFDSLRGSLNGFRTCYDVNFYRLEIRLDFGKKRLIGSNFIRFKVMRDFKVMQLDLFNNMLVEKVVYKKQNLRFTRDSNAFFVEFPELMKKNNMEEIVVFYYGKPQEAKHAPWDGGIVWTKDKQNNPWVGMACQGTGASLWWPCKDHQSDEPDSMAINVVLPKGMMDISNGELRKLTVLPDSTTRYEWFVNYPINTYDVTINVGNYAHMADSFKNANGEYLKLDYYVLPENVDTARKQFEQVKPMLSCFERFFGPYPFYKDGFKLVESPYLGMEHQSAVAYGNKYQNGYLGTDLSGTGEGMKFDYIIIHESAHEWWGNAVTTKDIADMWVHEGFGQYAEALYLECMFGTGPAQRYLNGLKKNIRNDSPIIGPYGVNEEGSGDMYPKGALLLNTIRHVLNNDSIWFSVLKGVNMNFRYKTTTTEEVEQYMTEKSGYDLSKIFKQYLRLKDLPVLEVERIQDGSDLLIKYRWISPVTFFDMPVKAAITARGDYGWLNPDIQIQSRRLANMKKSDFKLDEEDFYFKAKFID